MVKRNRVVITGMGVLAPNGIGLEAFWDSLLNGRSGIGRITLFDPSNLKSQIAGEVKNFNPSEYIEPELKPKRMARHTQFAYAATMMALQDAGLEINDADLPSPTPVVVGVSTSAMDIIERSISDFDRHGFHGMSPTAISALKPQAAANVIADRIGVRELRQNLSKYLRRVKDGEVLDVSERGRVVARLVPLAEGGERYAELAARFGASVPLERFEEAAAAISQPGAPAGTTDAELAPGRRERA